MKIKAGILRDRVGPAERRGQHEIQGVRIAFKRKRGVEQNGRQDVLLQFLRQGAEPVRVEGIVADPDHGVRAAIRIPTRSVELLLGPAHQTKILRVDADPQIAHEAMAIVSSARITEPIDRRRLLLDYSGHELKAVGCRGHGRSSGVHWNEFPIARPGKLGQRLRRHRYAHSLSAAHFHDRLGTLEVSVQELECLQSVEIRFELDNALHAVLGETEAGLPKALQYRGHIHWFIDDRTELHQGLFEG